VRRPGEQRGLADPPPASSIILSLAARRNAFFKRDSSSSNLTNARSAATRSYVAAISSRFPAAFTARAAERLAMVPFSA